MFMAQIIMAPIWFFNYNTLLELAFAIITLFVCIFSMNIYKLTKQRQSKLFSVGFLLISVSYFLQSLLNFQILSEFNEHGSILLEDMKELASLSVIGTYLQILFFILGLIMLVYITLDIKKIRIYFLLAVITIFSLLLSTNKIYLSYVFSSIFLIYISLHYFKNYINHKQIKTLLVLVAFIFLLFGSIHFIFSVNHLIYYIIGHVLELIAYLLIIINLILVVKKR